MYFGRTSCAPTIAYRTYKHVSQYILIEIETEYGKHSVEQMSERVNEPNNWTEL